MFRLVRGIITQGPPEKAGQSEQNNKYKSYFQTLLALKHDYGFSRVNCKHGWIQEREYVLPAASQILMSYQQL